jgi:hypothetical protein
MLIPFFIHAFCLSCVKLLENANTGKMTLDSFLIPLHNNKVSTLPTTASNSFIAFD